MRNALSSVEVVDPWTGEHPKRKDKADLPLPAALRVCKHAERSATSFKAAFQREYADIRFDEPHKLIPRHQRRALQAAVRMTAERPR